MNSMFEDSGDDYTLPNGLNYQGLYHIMPNGIAMTGRFHGISEKGYVPLPGIIDADLLYKSDGRFAQATINMKCYSRAQLILLDIL